MSVSEQIISGEVCGLCEAPFVAAHGYAVACRDCWNRERTKAKSMGLQKSQHQLASNAPIPPVQLPGKGAKAIALSPAALIELRTLIKPNKMEICPEGDEATTATWIAQKGLSWTVEGRKAIIVPVCQDGEVFAALDVSYGAELLFDGTRWHIRTDGTLCFTDQHIFLSDGYGFPMGALFRRVTQP